MVRNVVVVCLLAGLAACSSTTLDGKQDVASTRLSDPLYAGIVQPATDVEAAETEQTQALRAAIPVGTVTLLSQQVPSFPESTLAAGAYVATSGPAAFAIPYGEPGTLTLHDRKSGQYVKSIEVPYPAYLPPGVAPNAMSVAVPGALGDIYVNQILTGIYRVNTLLGFAEQHTTGPLPDVPPCDLDASGACSVSSPCPNPAVPGAPTCDAQLGFPALANGLLATEDGTLYSSDSFQAAIWRVRAETRTYELWLSCPELEGNIYSFFPAGANGLAKGPDNYLYVTNTSAGPMMGGAIYRVPMIDHPAADDVELVAAWAPFTIPGVAFPMPHGPDGIKFDVDGNLWVTFSFGNAVAKLDMRDGVVVAEQRFTYTPPEGGVPFHQPSELHLDSRQTKAFFGNHALEPPTPANWALFSIETGVKGQPLEKPWLGWDCTVYDCAQALRNMDRKHAIELAIEELRGL